MAKMAKYSMSPLGLQDSIIQMIYIKTLTMRTKRNMTLILRQLMMFQKVKRNYIKPEQKLEHKKSQKFIQGNSIQDEIEEVEVAEAEQTDDFIEDYVMND